MSSRRLGLLAFSLAWLAPALAWADKVAVLKFTGAPGESVQDARKSTREAVALRTHTLPSDAELAAAEAAVVDGVPDSSSEYRAAGAAAGAKWTAVGRVEAREGGVGYRLELEVCLVETGRVESLVREIDAGEGAAEIAEMLDLFLRAEGIGTELPPWKKGGPKAKPPPKPEPPKPEPPKPEPPKAPAKPEPPPRPYAADRSIAVGLGVGGLVAVSRPDRASGSTFSLPISLYGAYAFEAVPGLEARLFASLPVVGPQAIDVDVGARYAIPVVPRLRVFAGPEVGLGVLGTLGGDKTTRFVVHGSAFGAIAIGGNVQAEIVGDLLAAPGGSGTLLLAGGTLRGLYRF